MPTFLYGTNTNNKERQGVLLSNSEFINQTEEVG